MEQDDTLMQFRLLMNMVAEHVDQDPFMEEQYIELLTLITAEDLMEEDPNIDKLKEVAHALLVGFEACKPLE